MYLHKKLMQYCDLIIYLLQMYLVLGNRQVIVILFPSHITLGQLLHHSYDFILGIHTKFSTNVSGM